jgi:hypothetical protein
MENKTFTREDIKEYKIIQDSLYQRCNEICDILKRYKPEYGYATGFQVLEDLIYCSGISSEHDSKKNIECYCIPIDYLFMTDEELQTVVDEKINERNEKERIKQEENKRAQEEKERQMYEVLKQKYGGTETIGRKPFNIVKRGK